MLYAIIGRCPPDSGARRLAVRDQHLQRLQALRDAGRLVLAGPFPVVDSADAAVAGYDGGLIVAEFAALCDAEEWARLDPYVAADVYRDVTVRPFIQALP